MGHGVQHGDLPVEIHAEQQKLLDADLIVLQFPLWWYNLPAILKGWIDRVFTSGFGFDYRSGPIACRAATVVVPRG